MYDVIIYVYFVFGICCLTAVSSGRGVVDDVERVASEATQPLCYVLAFDAGNLLCLYISRWLIVYCCRHMYTNDADVSQKPNKTQLCSNNKTVAVETHGPLCISSVSSNVATCDVPRTRTTLGDRSFTAAGPHLWNNLPLHLSDLELSLSEFRRLLKTYLFG